MMAEEEDLESLQSLNLKRKADVLSDDDSCTAPGPEEEAAEFLEDTQCVNPIAVSIGGATQEQQRIFRLLKKPPAPAPVPALPHDLPAPTMSSQQLRWLPIDKLMVWHTDWAVKILGAVDDCDWLLQ